MRPHRTTRILNIITCAIGMHGVGIAHADTLLPLALEVANPSPTDQRIVQLDDLVGPHARPTDNNERLRGLVLIGTDSPERVRDLPSADRIRVLDEFARAHGSRVVVIVLGARAQRQRDEAPTPSAWPSLTLLDPHRLILRNRFRFGPGWILIVRADGDIIRRFEPGNDALERASEFFQEWTQKNERLKS